AQVLGSRLGYELVGRQIILREATLAEASVGEPLTRSITVAQTVTGVVTDDSNSPIPGVNVLVKGTSVGTTTDTQGRYTLEVPDGSAVLVFSFIRYQTQEVAVGTQTTINVSL